MKRTPRLRTGRLLLISLTPAHIPELCQMYDQPAISRYLGGTLDREAAAARVRGFATNPPDHGWVVRDHDGALVGLVELAPHPEESSLALGFQLLPAGWELAAEALTAVLDFAYESLNQASVSAETRVHNYRALQLLTDLGFTKVRRRRRFGAWQQLLVRPRGRLKAV